MDHTSPKDRLLVDDDKSALGRLAKTAGKPLAPTSPLPETPLSLQKWSRVGLLSCCCAAHPAYLWRLPHDACPADRG